MTGNGRRGVREWRLRIGNIDRWQWTSYRERGTKETDRGTDTEGQKTGLGGHRIWKHVDRGQGTTRDRTADGQDDVILTLRIAPTLCKSN